MLFASTPTGANTGESSFVYLGGKIPIDASTFLQNILDLYFKYFKLPEDVVNRILQVVLDLQHFKSSLVIFAATILQSSSAIHHISNIDNYVHQIIEFQSILITSSRSLWSSQSFGHQKGVCPSSKWIRYGLYLSRLLKASPILWHLEKGKFHGGLDNHDQLICT
ncbi:hypothetical protein Tco_1327264 [Tanacetum coccineum]